MRVVEAGVDDPVRPARRVVRIEGELWLVVETSGGTRVLSARCPHRGAPLEDGLVCEGLLVCPWHRSVFSVETGQVLSGPSRRGLRSRAASELVGLRPSARPARGHDG